MYNKLNQYSNVLIEYQNCLEYKDEMRDCCL